jgi:hypothetical protein
MRTEPAQRTVTTASSEEGIDKQILLTLVLVNTRLYFRDCPSQDSQFRVFLQDHLIMLTSSSVNNPNVLQGPKNQQARQHA